MSLREELAAFAATMPSRIPAERRAIMERATQSLTASGIVERAAKAGDRAPDFALPDAVGRTVALADLLAKGPVVAMFYRGGWCPFCNMQLRAYQRFLPEFAGLGASPGRDLSSDAGPFAVECGEERADFPGFERCRRRSLGTLRPEVRTPGGAAGDLHGFRQRPATHQR